MAVSVGVKEQDNKAGVCHPNLRFCGVFVREVSAVVFVFDPV